MAAHLMACSLAKNSQFTQLASSLPKTIGDPRDTGSLKAGSCQINNKRAGTILQSTGTVKITVIADDSQSRCCKPPCKCLCWHGFGRDIPGSMMVAVVDGGGHWHLRWLVANVWNIKLKNDGLCPRDSFSGVVWSQRVRVTAAYFPSLSGTMDDTRRRNFTTVKHRSRDDGINWRCIACACARHVA